MTEQGSMFDPLDRPTSPARRTDPGTSHAAAKMPFRRGSQRHLLLMQYTNQYALHADGLIDEEAAEWAGIHRGCPWKRCSELREDLLIAPTGVERLAESGAWQRVCAITGKGAAVLEDMKEP